MGIMNKSCGVGRGIKNTLPEGLYVNPRRVSVKSKNLRCTQVLLNN